MVTLFSYQPIAARVHNKLLFSSSSSSSSSANARIGIQNSREWLDDWLTDRSVGWSQLTSKD